MKPSDLADNIISRMSLADRRRLRVQTAEEAMQAFVVRSERELQGLIVNLLKLRGVLFLNPPMSKKSPLPIGWADFTIFLPSRTVFLECKIGKNGLTIEQELFRERVIMLGFEHYVVSTLAETKAHLDKV